MKISYKWLKQYINLPDSLTAEEIALKMTMAIVEVEEIFKQGKNLENIVVGVVKKVEKHPDADKLKIAQVDLGEKTVQIVCGGTNLKEKMKVAVAKIGSKVRWHGEGDLVEMKEAKIRGVESFGMICAASELGLENMFNQGETEILDLTHLKSLAGTNLATALGLDDIIFDIDNKSMTHRPDLWGHYGMAREITAVYNKKLKEYLVKEIKSEEKEKIEVEVKETKLCPRYMAVMIDNVEVKESTSEIQERLLAAGLRPINNIVDITNYVMLDLGQPLHAFDKNNLATNKIIVRSAKENEKFFTLDGKEHNLNSDNLVIADTEKAIAIAGVMGGLNSEIKNETKTIIFESANFEPSGVRKTALKLGIRTDSSARFEKSLDPNLAELALKKAVELILKSCPKAKVVSNVVDINNFAVNKGPIEISYEFLFEKMGEEMDKKQVLKILDSLGFVVKEKKDILSVEIPSWRATKDISIKEDIVEEVARIYGYDNFKKVLPNFPIIPPQENRLRKLERKIKDILAWKFGFTENLNYSFISPKLIEKMGSEKDDFVELDNPIAKDEPFLRRDLLGSLLTNLEKNSHDYDELAFFEIGKVFKKEEPGERMEPQSDELLPRQDNLLSIVYMNKNDEKPFFELANVLNFLFKELGLKAEIENDIFTEKFIHPNRAGVISLEKEKIGFIAELHPQTQKDFGLNYKVALLEINLNKIVEEFSEKNNYNTLSIFPPVLRDLAFTVSKDIKHKDILQTILAQDFLIKNVELFDVYEGEKISADKKSLAYHIIFSSKEKTLETNEVDKIFEKICQELKNKFGAELRK
ncbi:MAG: phenylalanine--tRNA ligase subunit beta [Patescibacteria group bacterium]